MSDEQIDAALDPRVVEYATVRRLRQESRGTKRSFKGTPRNLGYAIRLLWRSAPRLLIVVVALRVFSGLMSGALVLITHSVLKSGGNPTEGSLLRFLPFVVVLIVTSSIGAGSGQLQGLLAARAQRTIYDEILNVSASVELASYESPAFYDHLKRVDTNALAQPTLVSGALMSLASDGIGVIAATAALLVVQPLLLPLLVVSIFPFFLVARLAGRREFEFAQLRTLGDRQREYLRTVLTAKDEAKEVRAFGSGKLLRQRYEKRYDEYLVQLRRQARRRMVVALMMQLATIAVVGSWIGLIVYLFTSGRSGVAELGAAAVAAPVLLARFAGLGSTMSNLFQASLFIADFRSFLDLKGQEPADGPKPEVAKFEEIVAEDVHFTYPGAAQEALRGVSIQLRTGEVVALVGENGSGKTTLAKVIGQLYRPTSGRVLVDGVDASTFDPAALRRHMAVIFQDFVRYQLPASENVGLGNPDVIDDIEGITAASSQAGAHEFLEPLPEGYDTILSKAFPGGVDLSIGQWQRVALARAFFREAPFIILDEPTAALDARAEHALFERIRELRRGRTVLLISHRFSTVRSADRIYVLRKGEVVEHGTHDALMAKPGLYAELYGLQTSIDLQPAQATIDGDLGSNS